MGNRINQICVQFADQFWYPHMSAYIEKVVKSPWVTPKKELDLEKLYAKRTDTFALIRVLVSKIFHHLKLVFSQKYRFNFDFSVRALMIIEGRLKESNATNAMLLDRASKENNLFEMNI